jgi:hypothetical protein
MAVERPAVDAAGPAAPIAGLWCAWTGVVRLGPAGASVGLVDPRAGREGDLPGPARRPAGQEPSPPLAWLPGSDQPAKTGGHGPSRSRIAPPPYSPPVGPAGHGLSGREPQGATAGASWTTGFPAGRRLRAGPRPYACTLTRGWLATGPGSTPHAAPPAGRCARGPGQRAPTANQRARREVELASVRDCYDDPHRRSLTAAPTPHPASLASTLPGRTGAKPYGSCPRASQSGHQLAVGYDGGETARALLDKERLFPVLVQHVQPVGLDPQAAAPVAASTAWVGPTGAVLADLKAPSGRWASDGTCSSCSAPTLYRIRALPPNPRQHPPTYPACPSLTMGGGHRAAARPDSMLLADEPDSGRLLSGQAWPDIPMTGAPGRPRVRPIPAGPDRPGRRRATARRSYRTTLRSHQGRLRSPLQAARAAAPLPRGAP